MNAARALILAAFLAVLAVPFLLRGWAGGGAGVGADAPDARSAQRLIVITPHIEQIRLEFARAFDRWHQRRYGQRVVIDYRAPGGTTEILQLLQAQYLDRLASGLIKPDGSAAPGTIDFDVMFGGGTYDHGRLKRGVTTRVGGQEVSVPMSIPPRMDDGSLGLPLSALGEVFGAASVTEVARDLAGVDQARRAQVEGDLRRRFGINADDERVALPRAVIGAGYLFDLPDASKGDPGQFWIGTALSGFGIIYNRDNLASLGLGEPKTFEDLTAPAYFNQLALADPRQSGSVATAYDSILNEAARRALAGAPPSGAARDEALARGWDAGWRTLREMTANARYFTSASTQPPMDVSQGEAAAGVAIDFYGRGQAQAILTPGRAPGAGRMGYVDPAGAVYVDADPVSILRGGPNPVLARRFVEFCLSDEAQALWQFPPRGPRAGRVEPGASGPSLADLGPVEYRLRRLPVKRAMYDREGPYWPLLADQVDPFALASQATTQGWRDAMIVMMGCWIDAQEDLRAAWRALIRARGDAAFPPQRLAEMERLFYALPEHTLADGRAVPFGAQTWKAISDDTKRWNDPRRGPRAKIAYTRFFKAQWRRVVDLAGGARP